MMNEFGIVYLLPNEVRLYHERLSYELEEKFRLKGTFKLNAPSHITLKYRFNAERIELVEKAVQAFCSEQEPTPWQIEGFNFFKNDGKRVIFLDVKPSEAMREAHGRLLSKLKEIDWMQWGEFDHNQLHYHVTLAHKGVTVDNFDMVWSFVTSRPTPMFDMVFDHVALLKIENNVHRIYRQFQSR